MRLRCVLCLGLALGFSLTAHDGLHPSLHDAVAGAKERYRRSIPPRQLVNIKSGDLAAALTQQEREVLSTEAVQFTVTLPVSVNVLVGASGETPFWLEPSGFVGRGTVALETSAGEVSAQIWSKDFPAGSIGLGVNALAPAQNQYAVVVLPLETDQALTLSELYPGALRAARLAVGVSLFADREVTLKTLPAEFAGGTIVQTLHERRNDGAVVGDYRITKHPANDHPDQVTLTWSGDPRSTQTIQWRTGVNVQKGRVIYGQKDRVNRYKPSRYTEVEAVRTVMTDDNLINDPTCHRFTVTLAGLEAGTPYVYAVGTGKGSEWGEWREFRTAPDGVEPFSFVYMGDAQNGLDRWGTLVKNAFRARPDAAFYVMAGDLVNRGNDRDDWDSFFHNGSSVFRQRQLVPAIGNHENQGGHPTLYLRNFTLPFNGAEGVEPERTYSFEYSNAQFIILDSNLAPEDQVAWLDRTLSESKARWRFVVYHHPAYSSAPKRDNAAIREHWLPIFDKYHVDLALQGHDHAYLRTHPMKGGQRVASAEQGTVYIVSVSGTKMYDQDPRDYTEVGFTKIATYQVLDIQLAGDRLLYRAYDLDGSLKDEFEIVKSQWRDWE